AHVRSRLPAMRAIVAATLVVFAAAAPSLPTCGQTPIKPDLTVSGSVVNGSWPWTVAICHEDWFGNCAFKAAGVIINERWILSTYSALFEFGSGYYVKAGVIDPSDRNEEFEQFISVKMSYANGITNNTTHVNDFALIELSRPLRFTDHVQPICLANKNDDETKAGVKAWFTAWGNSQASSSTAAQSLHQAQLSFEEPGTCKNSLGYFYDNSQLCVGSSGKTPCTDDMGGPLMEQRADGAWYLLGLSATANSEYVERGCESASIFTRVSIFCTFIVEIAGIMCR
ncbi:hypothetical protein PFISCL1PPCAC_11372, partial [Pristionchus fissidentatus]